MAIQLPDGRLLSDEVLEALSFFSGVTLLAHVGLRVREIVGRVRDVQQTGASAYLLAVQTAAGELLIPFAAHICTEIDLAARRIVVSLPEGLRESQ